jgi:tetratricopeptide (TPR) repeat protein
MLGVVLAALVVLSAAPPALITAPPSQATVGRPANSAPVALSTAALPDRPAMSVLVAGDAQPTTGAETQAVQSARDGRYAEAIALATQLLNAEPDRLAARLIRALSYYYTAQPSLALDDLDKALELAPTDGTARTLRALVHLELGNYAETTADAWQAANTPGLPDENVGAAFLAIGRVLIGRGQPQEAVTYFQRVADRPDMANARVARIALELLAAIPAPRPDQAVPVGQDAGNGLQAIELPGRRVRFQSENGVTAAGAAAVVRLLDGRLAAIAALTGVSYSGPVQLVVYKSEWELERAIGGQYRGPGLSRALRQGIRSGDGPWQQRVHISITNPSLLFDLTHEAVHLVQAEVGLDDAFAGIPAWLVEGHAEHVAAASLGTAAPESLRLRLGQRNSGVVPAARADRLLDLRRLERFRDWSTAQSANAEFTYGQAYYAAALLHERYGFAASLAMLHAVSTGWPFEQAFRTVTRTAVDSFYADALDYTRQQVLAAEP